MNSKTRLRLVYILATNQHRIFSTIILLYLHLVAVGKPSYKYEVGCEETSSASGSESSWDKGDHIKNQRRTECSAAHSSERARYFEVTD